MFISDRLVFIELHKTGCTHIRKVLSEVIEGVISGKHNQATPDLFTEGRLFVGSIRNPWDWYVSLWGFGCDGNGGLRQRVAMPSSGIRGLKWRTAPASSLIRVLKRPKNERAWQSVYRNSDDPGAFRDWLHMMHDQAYIGDIGEGYSDCALRHVAGLLTYRYLKLFSTRGGEEERLNDLSTKPQIDEWDAAQTFVEAFIRMESLEADMFRILDDHAFDFTEEHQSRIRSLPKTNASSRQRKLSHYYDPDTVALVAEREQLIINKFSYTPPDL
ncbi:hypothetical protein PB2503_02847 [Parvularcula bermudensis HTCC2503]|uniref:Sulfotransferase family protein n=1 Tax=Parvularcula bermudensis (strain ATCC BAA-594 / HTCC2503 / KCTC 12087) TaxID=314260 RepID=E0TCQ7_PARBH|nr:hypothetical protein [Parvularcula bermudensis]ADM08646.1 hypothetical protein PB2503_02847 [Parvularcula bermudensis HTCC2503]